jgi:ABC-type lipoprotein release transport system permease subunit
MTNKQRAVFETAKMVAIFIAMGLTFSTIIQTGYGVYLGIAMVVFGLVYALIMMYEMKLGQIESKQRLDELSKN